MLASVMFKRYCESEAGLFVYEKIELGEEYFFDRKPLKNYNEYSERDRRMALKWGENYNKEKNLYIDKFSENYLYKYSVSDIAFEYGPIHRNTTTLIRKPDNKLLAKGVSFTNGQGWLANVGPFPPVTESCPHGYKTENRFFSNAAAVHGDLLKNTIIYRR